MKVKELIKLLSKEDPNAIVVCQSDSEGNNYSPLSCIESDGYVPDTTWSGERVIRELTEQLKRDGITEDEVDPDSAKAIFLIPVN